MLPWRFRRPARRQNTCEHSHAPRRLVSISRVHCSSVRSRNGTIVSIPALLTRISIGPSSFQTFSNIASTSVAVARRRPHAVARRPLPRIDSATSSASSGFSRSLMATSAPSSANTSAMPRPMPRPAPVTSAILSLSLKRISCDAPILAGPIPVVEHWTAPDATISHGSRLAERSGAGCDCGSGRERRRPVRTASVGRGRRARRHHPPGFRRVPDRRHRPTPTRRRRRWSSSCSARRAGCSTPRATIVSRMIRSRAPVVVFVAPSGARAASAGFILTIAADVAAMAPGTHIGAAHPVSGDRPDDGRARCRRRSASDAAAYARSLAEARQTERRARRAGGAWRAARSPTARRSQRHAAAHRSRRHRRRRPADASSMAARSALRRPHRDRCTPRDAECAARRDDATPAVP